jgi:hypothetical protein
MSKYIRKTIDVYDLEGYTGSQYGWELMTRELTRKEAQERRKEYRENQPQYSYRIVKRREPKETYPNVN